MDDIIAKLDMLLEAFEGRLISQWELGTKLIEIGMQIQPPKPGEVDKSTGLRQPSIH